MIWIYAYLAAAMAYGLLDKEMISMRRRSKDNGKYGASLIATVALSLSWPIWALCDVGAWIIGVKK